MDEATAPNSARSQSALFVRSLSWWREKKSVSDAAITTKDVEGLSNVSLEVKAKSTAHGDRTHTRRWQRIVSDWRSVIHAVTVTLFMAAHLTIAIVLSAHPYNAISLEFFRDYVDASPTHQRPVFTLFFWLLWAVTLSFYIVVSCSNPGFADEPLPASRAHLDRFHIRNKNPNLIYTCGVCQACNHIKLLRSKHCYACGHCVRRFDHHCPWVANCIGQGNHRSFIIYVSLQVVYFVTCLALACEAIGRKPESPWFTAPVVLLCGIVPFLIFTTMLLTMHLNYIDHNCTTYEVLRGFQLPHMTDNRLLENPYDSGDVKANRTHFWKEMATHMYSVPSRYRLLEGNPASSFV
eukprot:TRINITY_DN9743_c0_g1_i1.p1 TRINITY_DN9743_c0_g1~~TRINITY_DN9743_c0_g1_i1.p1  ORF type:complete len:350 (-),score=46.57 TRINITY_DN9743_c0_g1_i1:221-1270(-)